MKVVKVWCEWDMGFSNIDGDYYSVFENMEKAIETLENANWKYVEYSSWEEVEQDGLLTIEYIEI
jgi:hypothetical protein